jgi:hypothetical protein
MPLSSTTNAVLDSGAQIGAIQIFSGSGTPHNVLTAPKGSLFLRTDTGASTTVTRAYINLTGSSTWTSITTGA